MSMTFQVGDMTIHRLIEAVRPVRPILDFFPNLTPELLKENASWLRPDSLDDQDRIVLTFQSYIVRTRHHTILVDSCVGNEKNRPGTHWHQKNDRNWMNALATADVKVEDIDYVLCTHLHVDHGGWNTRLENGRWVPTFPNARYLFSEKELAFWTAEAAKTPIPHIEDSVLPIVAANRADKVSSDHALGDHVWLMPTPGHTIDHFAVALGRTGTEAVITGDLIHSPLQARFPQIQMRLDYDPAQAAATRRSFLEKFCDTGTVCCFAHFASPSKGYVKRWDEGFRCEYIS